MLEWETAYHIMLIAEYKQKWADYKNEDKSICFKSDVPDLWRYNFANNYDLILPSRIKYSTENKCRSSFIQVCGRINIYWKPADATLVTCKQFTLW